VQVYPYCNEITKLSPQGWQPHVTLGKFKNKTTASNLIKTYTTYQPVEFMVTQINILSRIDSEPYEIRKTIPIGRQITAPYFPDVPIKTKD